MSPVLASYVVPSPLSLNLLGESETGQFAQSTGWPTVHAVPASVVEPVAISVTEPVARSITDPVAESAVDPVAKSPAEPVARSVVESSAESASASGPESVWVTAPESRRAAVPPPPQPTRIRLLAMSRCIGDALPLRCRSITRASAIVEHPRNKRHFAFKVRQEPFQPFLRWRKRGLTRRFTDGRNATVAALPRRSRVPRPRDAPSPWKIDRRATQAIALAVIESPHFCEIVYTVTACGGFSQGSRSR